MVPTLTTSSLTSPYYFYFRINKFIFTNKYTVYFNRWDDVKTFVTDLYCGKSMEYRGRLPQEVLLHSFIPKREKTSLIYKKECVTLCPERSNEVRHQCESG